MQNDPQEAIKISLNTMHLVTEIKDFAVTKYETGNPLSDHKAKFLELAHKIGFHFDVENGEKITKYKYSNVDNLKISDIENDIGHHIKEWIFNPEDFKIFTTFQTNPHTVKIIEKISINSKKLLFLLRFIYQIKIVYDGYTMLFHKSGNDLKLEYKNKRIIWSDGVIQIRNESYPLTVRSALQKQSVDKIIKDPFIGDEIIRVVCETSPKDRIMRIVTFDYMKKIIFSGV
jgi:hypothetical protein